MEVHPAFGSPAVLEAVLVARGLTCEFTDNDGAAVAATGPTANYLYASRR